MHTGAAVPGVALGSAFRDALVEITSKGLGMTAIVDDDGRIAGVFTDGDLRRTLDSAHDLHTTTIDDVMTPNGVTIGPDALAAEALSLMQERRINAVLVVDETQQLVGALNMHTLLRAGVA